MLAGVGLGTIMVHIVCLQPIMGMNGAAETLVSQAYGANQLRQCGVYLNRGRLINTVLFIPLVVIICFSRPILTAFGQDPEVIDHAMTYITVCIPSVYFQIMFDLKKRFLNCMTYSWVPMLAQTGGTILHVLWCYILVVHLDLQVVGLGLATAITNVGIFLMITIYAHCIPKIKESLFCFDDSAWSGWGEYFKLGVPSTVMICAEWWAFEILIFLAGAIGVKEQAAMVIINQITTQTYMVNLGMQESSTALIGN